MTNYKSIFKLWYVLDEIYSENRNFNDLIYDRSQNLNANFEFEENFF